MWRHWASSAMQQDPIKYNTAVSIIISKIYFLFIEVTAKVAWSLAMYILCHNFLLIITSRHY